MAEDEEEQVEIPKGSEAASTAPPDVPSLPRYPPTSEFADDIVHQAKAETSEGLAPRELLVNRL